MNLRQLRRIRIVVSIIFFVVMTILFLDIGRHIPQGLVEFLTSLQFVPALLKSLTVVSVSVIGLGVLTLSTVLFGRLYCSSICPLGTLQDVIIFVSNKFKGKRRFRYRTVSDIPQYVILASALLLGAGGSLLVVNLLDPFSNFGRIVVNLVRPIEILLHNLAAGILNGAGIYVLYQIPLPGPDFFAAGFSFLLLLLVIYLCIGHGRLFCNLLCPVGALLKLISRHSIYRLDFNNAACKDCTLCEKVCKARCIDSKAQRIDFGSCINCFNCASACPTTGIVYRSSLKAEPRVQDLPQDGGRRKVVGSLGSAFVLLGTAIVSGNGPADTAKASRQRRKTPVSPPGSISVLRFSQLCTACHLCMSSCPMRVITPSFFGYGIAGVFQPSLDYNVGYCKYECNLCSLICPSGAIAPISVEQKKEIQLGKAQFVKEECIVVTKKTECGACSEHCPTKAVTMVPYEKLLLPELNNDICVGCGACEHACPTKPDKAIYIESNPVHQQAKKPVIKKLEKEIAPQDFPF